MNDFLIKNISNLICEYKSLASDMRQKALAQRDLSKQPEASYDTIKYSIDKACSYENSADLYEKITIDLCKAVEKSSFEEKQNSPSVIINPKGISLEGNSFPNFTMLSKLR